MGAQGAQTCSPRMQKGCHWADPGPNLITRLEKSMVESCEELPVAIPLSSVLTWKNISGFLKPQALECLFYFSQS